MARTITLTNLVITAWTYSPINPRVTVSYQLQDSTGRVYESGESVFWAKLPVYAPPAVIPANWYQLPALQVTQLAQLTDLASIALAGLLT